MSFITYAIDLGTTNSLIAQGKDGQIKVFKNPKGFREALPSVVAFRKNATLVGEKARELKDRDPHNVFSVFKRKMGTDEQFYVQQLEKNISPIELSSIVLNELRTFLPEEQPKSVVITIPASFDTIQSNATKTAGNNAGFEEVVLLQEPIAACLAVFNQPNNNTYGKWLIYDLGGGTFDVAIVEITEESMKVVDHEGNNYLGGIDIDSLIVTKILIPQLAKNPAFKTLSDRLIADPQASENMGIFNRLIFYAEQMKIECSSYPESFVEAYLTTDDGEQEEIELSLTRAQLENLMEQPISMTIDLIRQLLKKNQLTVSDFNEIILVGGSTYSPFVRKKIEEELQLKANQEVDPTTAIAVGAAFYASNKTTSIVQTAPTVTSEALQVQHQYDLRPIYESTTREESELVVFKPDEFLIGKQLRVYRSDFGYDSGKVAIEATTRLLVNLVKGTSNLFYIEVSDENGILENIKKQNIVINQGMFSIDGQPLPHDISIELDDLDNNQTKLECIFRKNDILPLSKTIYRTTSKNLLINNLDDELQISILEGNQASSPSSNQRIGTISIKPSEIQKNIPKNMEISIQVSISESRDISVTASISALEVEVNNVFNPTTKHVALARLKEDLNFLLFKSRQQQTLAEEDENYERAELFLKIHNDAEDALEKLGKGEPTSDTKYHVEEWKRQIAVRFDELTLNQRWLDAVESYNHQKAHLQSIMQSSDFSSALKAKVERVFTKETNVFKTGNVSLLNDLNNQLQQLSWEYRQDNIPHLLGIYANLKFLFDEGAYTDMSKAKAFIDRGDQIVYREGVDKIEVHHVLGNLFNLLKPEYLKGNNENPGFDLKGTGLS